MAEEHYFIYMGGGRQDIPADATHVTVHPSVTVILRNAFVEHPNIVELICHAGLVRIEDVAFFGCRRLRRVIIPGVKILEHHAFCNCKAVTDIECSKLERIGGGAFSFCDSLSNINLPSAKIVEGCAFFLCKALTDVKFSKQLESIEGAAFQKCHSLERLTIPLKNGLFAADNTFAVCDNLMHISLVEGDLLHGITTALLLEDWKNDMNEEIGSINQILPNAPAGGENHIPTGNGMFQYNIDDGEKAREIREWIRRLLRKIIHYEAEHNRLLQEASSSLILAAPNEIVVNNVVPFIELPSHTFHDDDD